MFWTDALLKPISGEQIINDSKTPSGRVHVGALRGVLIHDAVFRVLKEMKVPVRYLYGVDDYDPVDEIPAGQDEHFEKYLGMPLCQVPPPPGSDASDMAQHFISEFLQVFKDLDVEAEIYRMRDIYRSGQFNEAIDRILSHAHVVREVYRKVSGSERPDDWYPFQVVCEQCGRIGTTEVFDYTSGKVSYRCRPDLVTWARGCGHEGSVEPFDGRGKLPWKLEWVAKWVTFPVTIEGAGKDHSTKGGSRDVSAQILRRVFQKQPPLNIPYEFFLVGGAKMSSSKGLGVSAYEMSQFLPREILRFLMIRPKPNKPVNFEPDEKSISKLFYDFDRYAERYYASDDPSLEDRRIFELSETRPEGEVVPESFQIITTLLQLPHLDVSQEVSRRLGRPLTEVEQRKLDDRIRAARFWLDHYASEDEKLLLQEQMPSGAGDLNPVDVAFLHRLADLVSETEWEEEALQGAIFEAARTTPIPQPRAFAAIYRVFLDREMGPKAGNLFAFLEPEFVISRLRELPLDEDAFMETAAMDPDAFLAWHQKEREKIASLHAEGHFRVGKGPHRMLDGQPCMALMAFSCQMRDGKRHRKWVLWDDTTPEALHQRVKSWCEPAS